MARLLFCFVLVLSCAAFTSAAEVVQDRDDLAATKLPNGIAKLAREGSHDSFRAGGYIFRFSDRTFHFNPFEDAEKKNAAAGQPGPGEKAKNRRPTGQEIIEAVRKEKTGDLTYTPLAGGTLVSWSGRISDLGAGYLYELNDKELPRPAVVFSKEERNGKTGEGYPGCFERIHAGHRYLIETTDARYALVRLLENTPDQTVLQWVYQPDGTALFQIPKAEPIKYTAQEVPPVRPVVQRPTDTSAPGGGRRLATTLRAKVTEQIKIRAELIKELIAAVGKPTAIESDEMDKSFAIVTLGELRAAEATDVLVANIEFFDRHARMSEVTLDAMYPCVGALKQIGKPGSLAAVKAIRDARPVNDKGEKDDKSLERIRLLTVVVHGVEGPEVAKFILERELARAVPQSQESLKEALRYLATKLPADQNH